MKKIVISKSQLMHLNESEALDISVTAKGNNSSDYVNALTNSSTVRDIQNVKGVANDANAIVSGPDTDDSKPVIDVNVPKGSTVQNTISNNPSLNTAAENGSAFKVHGDGYPNESKVYSKKQVEEARLKKMRTEGKTMTKAQLNSLILQEGNEKKKMIRQLYKVTSPYTSRLLSDDAWQGVSEMLKAVRELPFVSDLYAGVNNGGYRKNDDGAQWKEYLVTIETTEGINIQGILNCHAAGTMEDPFKCYDMTFTFY